MADLCSELTPRLLSHRLPGLDLGDGFVYPQYSGQSILNIPATVCHLFGAPPLAGEPLSTQILESIAGMGQGEIRRVILVLMDAMGLRRLQLYLTRNEIPLWNRLVSDGVLVPLTSITPSTTSAALISLWTGRSPAEHGVVGYELWLKEYGLVANMIRHTPMSFKADSRGGSLSQAGFQPEQFMPVPTIGPHLSRHGVQTSAFQHGSIIRSGLSTMLFKGVDVKSFSGLSDLWVNLRKFVESESSQRMYVWVYWGEMDYLSHLYGPEDERTAAEFVAFNESFERLFLSKLSSKARQGTLLLFTADHGQITTPNNPHYDLRNHPGLVRRLHIYPTGENRLTYLFIRPGQSEAVREYIQRTWPGQFSLMDPGYATRSGLFGPGKPHPSLADRMGELLVAGRGNAYFWWGQSPNPITGRHGGLSADEMLVPLLALRL
jgi:hypothetical protein